jgi:hypothetical protein
VGGGVNVPHDHPPGGHFGEGPGKAGSDGAVAD